MKKFMNKSTLALLLTVLMLLSAITVGASLFAASAEETPEATLIYADGTEETGNLVDLANKANALDVWAGTKIELNKDVELSTPLKFNIGRIARVEGNGHTIHFNAKSN